MRFINIVRSGELRNMDNEKLSELAREVFAFRKTITPESDRGCALMAGSFLDVRLKNLISKTLVPNGKLQRQFFSFTGAAGTFSSRIDYAFLTGLIPKTVHSDLHNIRQIRNEFGHRVEPISFETKEISERCDAFVTTNTAKEDRPRLKFTNTCFGVLSSIDVATVSAESASAPQDLPVPEDSRTRFLEKFSAALDGISDEDIAENPIEANNKLVASMFGDLLEPSAPTETEQEYEGRHLTLGE